ncbi:alkaline phosphatase family protein [Curtobacterium sp. ISL-83]|uniref:alkaline phosphatase family protein n=1 Tax=Curtobacterium sp. ISL-83 TaxID=2819145 RepID=UPI001BE6ED9C|nr:alkaline phosphatase family protein [Curtobacterium sp. ISL-83]MBT2503868.1 hypothetical protein [Curtobacterium sp. ISL-83]
MPTAPAAPTAGASSRTAPASAVQHVVVIVDENKPATTIIGNPSAPYLNALAAASARATDYSAITHPSLPNYLALTSGTTGGITSDCNPPGGSCLVPGKNLADEIHASGRSWKMYAEGMPAPCTASNAGRYAVKHDPFLYFPDVTADHASCADHVVPSTSLSADLRSASTLPDFAFVSPDLCDDMHDCSVATGDAWLARTVPAILHSPAFTQQRSLLVVTFDEGNSGDNTVACILAGSAAAPRASSATAYDHYSLLRTIEVLWGLPPLTSNDAHATPMLDLLRR